MSTRTTGKRKALRQRIITRWEQDGCNDWTSGAMQSFVRAEFDRLARQIRKIEYTQMSDREASVVFTVLNDVLALIKEGKR